MKFYNLIFTFTWIWLVNHFQAPLDCIHILYVHYKLQNFDAYVHRFLQHDKILRFSKHSAPHIKWNSNTIIIMSIFHTCVHGVVCSLECEIAWESQLISELD